MSMSTKDLKSKLLAMFMAFLMAFTMSSPFAASYAWAAPDGETSDVPSIGSDLSSVSVLSIVNNTGMPGGTNVQSSRSMSSPKDTTDVDKNFSVLVNPKAPNMTSGRPTQSGIIITVLEDDDTWTGYSMNVPAGSPLKVMKVTGEGEDAQFIATGDTVPATDFQYNPATGAMTIDKKYQDRVISIYNYLGANQTGDAPVVYAAEDLNGSNVALNTKGMVTADVDGTTETYYIQPSDNLNAVFSEMAYNGGDEGFLAYKVKDIVAYSATVVDGKVLSKWELTRGQDYQVTGGGKLAIDKRLNTNYVIVKSTVESHNGKITPMLLDKGETFLDFAKADGYSYRLLLTSDSSVVADWSSNAHFEGLENGTQYTVEYRNDATGDIYKKKVRTNGNTPSNFKIPLEPGETYSCKVYPWSWSEVGHTSFMVTIDSITSNGDNADGASLISEKTSGKQYRFYCCSPGMPNTAKYHYGQPMDATITVKSVNKTDGSAHFYLRSYGYYPAGYPHPQPNNGVQNMEGTFDIAADMPVQIELTKASALPKISDGNPNYSLEGAEYGIYSDEACTAHVATITTDATGYAISEDLKAGNYWVKETKVPTDGNMSLSDEVFFVDANQGGLTYSVGGGAPVEETPMTKEWRFYKVDKQSLLSAPQGGAEIKGAEFRVEFFAATGEGETGGMTPTRTWTLRSDDEGMIKLDADHLVSGDELFQDADGKYVYPMGVYHITETKAPKGYLLSDPSTHTITMSSSFDEQMSGNAVITHPDELKIADQVKRGDFDLVKINEATQQRMAGVPFLVTCNDNGESHVVVTDENGYLNSQSVFNPHTENTNANDRAVDANGDGVFTEDEINNLDESKLDAYAGVYFFGYNPSHEGYKKVAVEDEQYGLPFGNYTIRELPCKATEGMQIVNPTFNIIRNTYKVEIGTVSDHEIKIQTTATDQATNDHEGDPSQETVVILDDVDYKGLTPGREYTLKATLHVKSIAEDGTVVDEGPLMVNGAAVASTDTFVPKNTDGTYTMRFEVPGSALQTKSVVAFEELYDGTRFVIGHTDITDEGQTVNYPGIHTTATDNATGNHEGNAIDEETTINDVVAYEGLTPGREYTMSGKLMDKATERPLVDDEGHEFTAEVKFTPEASAGSVTLTYTLPTKYVAGKTIVVFEDCYNVRGPVASHADINDEDQTVYYPSLHTTATDSITKDHEGLAKDTVTINDLVEYENLIKGDTYTISGKIMDKATGEPLKGADGKEFTASATFVAGESADADEARELVDVYLEVAEKVLAIYDDMSAEEQGDFAQKLPEFSELEELIAEAEKDGTDVLDEDKEMLENLDKFYLSLTDEQKEKTTELVSVDKLYSAIKVLSAADDSDEGTTSGQPERVSGSVIVSFEIPADVVRGKTTVVFENLYTGETPSDETHKAKHEDINDEGQTVVYPEIHTTATIGGEKVAPARDVITITDTITYKNLTPGKEYTFTGKLMDKETNDTVKNEDGSEVIGETVFTPETPDGTVDVTFTFNAMAIQFHDVVIFEEGYRAGDVADELILVAEHKDINDADQTVRIDDAGLADELIETGELPAAGDIILYGLIAIGFLAGCYAFAYRHRKMNLFE